MPTGGATVGFATGLYIAKNPDEISIEEAELYLDIRTLVFMDVNWQDDSHLLVDVVTPKERDRVLDKHVSIWRDISVDVRWISEFNDELKYSRTSPSEDYVLAVTHRRYRTKPDVQDDYVTYVCIQRIGVLPRTPTPEEGVWAFVAKGKVDLNVQWTGPEEIVIPIGSLDEEDIFLRGGPYSEHFSISYPRTTQ